MADLTTGEKGCGPQPSDNDLPSHSWTIDQLTAYAKREYGTILTNERTVAPSYWRLGCALNIARKNFSQGQWGQYLASLDIDKTRASKARSIFGTFSTVDEVEGRTVEEAYAARRQDAPTKSSTPTDEQSELSVHFARILAKVEKNADRLFEGVAELTLPEKLELRKTLQQTLARLRAQLQQLDASLKGELAASK
jgi:hypothetical protein